MISKHQFLHVYVVKQSYRIRPTNITAVVGQIVQFKCLSRQQVIWKFNNGHVPLPSNVKKSYNSNAAEHILTIHRVRRDNEGVYDCEGELLNNSIGFYATAHLSIKSKFCLSRLI